MSDKLRGTILTANNFKIQGNNVFVTKNNGNPGMLFIHANWCSHCQHFLSTFNEICDSIGSDFTCASIESKSITSDLSTALNFKGFPTIKFFDQSGKIIGEYTKERKKEAILKEICKIYHHCISKH